jgi:ferredoxin--NADP+ reductase
VYLENSKSETAVSAGVHKISEIRFLTPNTFIIRMDRGNMQFKAGQHIIAGLQGELEQREYSVYSGENDDFLEILVREVRGGNVSVKLRNCRPGDLLQVNGPFGSFGIESFDMYNRKLIFIATGTGISPFHSFVRSYPGIDYTLIHGVHSEAEAYDRWEYDPQRYILCTSGKSAGGRKGRGRVTRFLPGFRVDREMRYYVCGNGNMIYEVYHILRDKGVGDEDIFTEIYF